MQYMEHYRKIIEEFEKEGIYEEPVPNKLYGGLKDWSKLKKWCYLVNKYPELINEIRKFDKEELDKQNKNGYTILMSMVHNNNVNCVKILLELGANPDLQDIRGSTALIKASAYGHEEIVKLLILVDADITKSTIWGDKAIDMAKTESITQILKEGRCTVKSAVI